ncbi:MAG: hypothetical protein IPM02_07920 [Betaproteobacteria bacterium]|nr:hypothetical protein [Betaproteobacteria bacterium]
MGNNQGKGYQAHDGLNWRRRAMFSDSVAVPRMSSGSAQCRHECATVQELYVAVLAGAKAETQITVGG